MVTSPQEHLVSVVSPLCEPLHDSFEWAADLAHQRREGHLEGPEYDWLGTHITRGLAHSKLAKRDDLAGWRVTGNHARNGELWLRHGMTRLRLLHVTSEKDVPKPGANGARRAYFRNRALFDLPVQEALPIAGASKLLGLWRVVNPATFEVAFRIVRTLGEVTPGQRCLFDVEFMLPRTAPDMDDMEWSPTEDEDEFWLPGEEDEGDGNTGGLLG
jgi:hypothetical protein